MAEPAAKTVHVVISGRVQGVWFRAWTRDQAGNLGLSGWVRNCFDGSVEAVFSGPADKVDLMVKACWTGSPMSNVSGVEVNNEIQTPLPGFKFRPSA